jgi:hypothetical protein
MTTEHKDALLLATRQSEMWQYRYGMQDKRQLGKHIVFSSFIVVSRGAK